MYNHNREGGRGQISITEDLKMDKSAVKKYLKYLSING